MRRKLRINHKLKPPREGRRRRGAMCLIPCIRSKSPKARSGLGVGGFWVRCIQGQGCLVFRGSQALGFGSCGVSSRFSPLPCSAFRPTLPPAAQTPPCSARAEFLAATANPRAISSSPGVNSFLVFMAYKDKLQCTDAQVTEPAGAAPSERRHPPSGRGLWLL